MPSRFRYLLDEDILSLVKIKYHHIGTDDVFAKDKLSKTIAKISERLLSLEPEKYDLFELDHTTDTTRLILVADSKYEALVIQSRFIAFNANDDTRSYTIRKRNS